MLGLLWKLTVDLNFNWIGVTAFEVRLDSIRNAGKIQDSTLVDAARL